MAGFAASVRLNSAKVLLDVNEKCYKIARTLFTLVVKLSPSPINPGPFAHGLLVNQWYPNNGVDFSTELTSATTRGGSDSILRIAQFAGLAFDGHDGTVTFANNLPYAYRAEALGWPQADGWSGTIGPYRMVERSIQTCASIFK